MCPWPRIQAAMMDEDTLTVAYRPWRGEPRGKLQKAGAEPTRGDCIDCMACVNVCPMGIDIRDGQQLACITCALCIDACDDVMSKIGKPRGLIGYLALKDETRERAGQPPTPAWRHALRPRTIFYTALWAAIGFGLVFALFIRSEIDIAVAPVRNPTFVTLSDGSIRNTYDIRLRNKLGEERPFLISMTAPEGMRIELEGSDFAILRVPADQLRLQRVYVIGPAGSPPARADRTAFRFWVEDLDSGARAHADTVFNGNAP
jgi:cytochrome c oxidase accessory protein FixG